LETKEVWQIENGGLGGGFLVASDIGPDSIDVLDVTLWFGVVMDGSGKAPRAYHLVASIGECLDAFEGRICCRFPAFIRPQGSKGRDKAKGM
jgi:hypothetical protein